MLDQLNSTFRLPLFVKRIGQFTLGAGMVAAIAEVFLNAFDFFTVWISWICTVLAIILWFGADPLLRHINIRTKRENLRLTGIGRGVRTAILGAVAMVWLPHAVSFVDFYTSDQSTIYFLLDISEQTQSNECLLEIDRPCAWQKVLSILEFEALAEVPSNAEIGIGVYGRNFKDETGCNVFEELVEPTSYSEYRNTDLADFVTSTVAGPGGLHESIMAAIDRLEGRRGIHQIIVITTGIDERCQKLDRMQLIDYAEERNVNFELHIRIVGELSDNEEAILIGYADSTDLASSPTQLGCEVRSLLKSEEWATYVDVKPIYRYEEGSKITSVAVSDGENKGIFTLDFNNNQVLWHKTESNYVNLSSDFPEIVLRGGQQFDGNLVGRILDISWLDYRDDNSFSPSLAVMHSFGALAISTENNLKYFLPQQYAASWVSPSAMVVFGGRLYILDSGTQRIQRYFPAEEAYMTDNENIFVEYLDELVLNDVIDFTLSSLDGSFLLLHQDGSLTGHSFNGELFDLIAQFAQPTAIKIGGTGLNSSVFVADPGTGRIVQISRTGICLSQIVVNPQIEENYFQEINDFVVIENPLRIIFVTNDGLFVAMID